MKAAILLILSLSSGCVFLTGNLTSMNSERVGAEKEVRKTAIDRHYKIEMARINTERERSGLRPLPLD